MFYKLFLTIPFASVCTAGMSQTNEKHNIVYVLLDDLAYDAIESTNRYPFLKTPNIDRLQSEGITFDNFFCTMALSSPSRSCMLTGMYPHKHGVTQNDSRVDANWENILLTRLICKKQVMKQPLLVKCTKRRCGIKIRFVPGLIIG